MPDVGSRVAEAYAVTSLTAAAAAMHGVPKLLDPLLLLAFSSCLAPIASCMQRLKPLLRFQSAHRDP